MNHTPFFETPYAFLGYLHVYTSLFKKKHHTGITLFRLEKIAKKLQGFLHKSFRGAPVVGEPQPTEMTIISSKKLPQFLSFTKNMKTKNMGKIRSTFQNLCSKRCVAKNLHLFYNKFIRISLPPKSATFHRVKTSTANAE